MFLTGQPVHVNSPSRLSDYSDVDVPMLFIIIVIKLVIFEHNDGIKMFP